MQPKALLQGAHVSSLQQRLYLCMRPSCTGTQAIQYARAGRATSSGLETEQTGQQKRGVFTSRQISKMAAGHLNPNRAACGCAAKQIFMHAETAINCYNCIL